MTVPSNENVTEADLLIGPLVAWCIAINFEAATAFAIRHGLV
jgi:hypothetical protein